MCSLNKVGNIIGYDRSLANGLLELRRKRDGFKKLRKKLENRRFAHRTTAAIRHWKVA